MMDSLVVLGLIVFGGVFGLVWLMQLLLTRDIQDATAKSTQNIGSLFVGFAAAFSVLVGEIVVIGSQLLSLLADTPGIVIAMIGLGDIAGRISLDPWMFIAIVAIVFLTAAAVRS